jgi:excisionase family DNA binding protein
MALVYRPEEVAVIVHLSLSAVYATIKRGELKAVKTGRSILITKPSLEQFLGTQLDGDELDKAVAKGR